MSVEILPSGASAVLVQVDTAEEVAALDAALGPADLPGVREWVPAARTVLVLFDGRHTSADFVGAAVRRLAASAPAGPGPPPRGPGGRPGGACRAPPPAGGGGPRGLAASAPAGPAPAPGPLVDIPVAYDGADLAAVAGHLRIGIEEVIARHTSTLWRVAFVGFAPGFPYLVGAGTDLRVPRHRQPRVSVPAGSVALADEYCGIYPRVSPGGWQLIGVTTSTVWDPTRADPALLTPGTRVRFVVAGQ